MTVGQFPQKGYKLTIPPKPSSNPNQTSKVGRDREVGRLWNVPSIGREARFVISEEKKDLKLITKFAIKD